MKQVLQTPDGIAVREVPPPTCPPGNVLVRNEFSAISSGTERAFAESTEKSIVARVAERPELALKAVDRVRREGIRNTLETVRGSLPGESPTGYSCAGVVVEVGASVRGLSVGDRVACAGAGHANHASVVSVPGNLCAKVPDGVSMEAAALTTIASIAMHGVRIADLRLGESAAVIGCGLVGQITCRLLQAAGVTVIALDLDQARVDDAVAAGAHHGVAVGDGAADAVLAATAGIGVDAALVTAAASTNDPLLLAAEVTRDRGAVVLVGVASIDVPREIFFQKELSFRVSRSYGPGRYDADYEQRGLDYPIAYVRWTEQRNMESVLDLQARGAVRLHDLVEEVVPVERAEQAYARLSAPPGERPRGALALSYPAEDEGRQAPPTAAAPAPAALGTGAPVRLGLLGPGSFARGVLVPAFREAGAALAVVAGGSGPSAETAVRADGFERFAAGDDELIADPDVDAVVIATRHDSHADLAARALRAGKHVFCEKPLALDQAQLDEVLAAARAGDRVLTVGFNRRFAPHARTVRDLAAGVEGPVAAVYRVSAGQVPAASWVHDLAEGGGRIIGECCHFFDTLAFVVGSPIAQVHAAGFGAAGQPVQARDNLMISVTFGDGSVGTIAYVAEGSPAVPKERLELFAGSRTALLEDYVTLETLDGSDRGRDRLRKQDKGHRAEAERFLDGVRHGSNPIPLESIDNVHRACFAAVESLRTGAPVRLPA
jgi:predicted dehydrogenase/threonine dehydrogenase-like Zn-dependent dehydrogenase